MKTYSPFVRKYRTQAYRLSAHRGHRFWLTALLARWFGVGW